MAYRCCRRHLYVGGYHSAPCAMVGGGFGCRIDFRTGFVVRSVDDDRVCGVQTQTDILRRLLARRPYGRNHRRVEGQARRKYFGGTQRMG